MKISRRNFIKSIGASSLLLASAQFEVAAQNSVARLKIVVFWEENFPVVDGVKLTKKFIADALKNHDVIFAGAEQLKTVLDQPETDVFINPYGSAFPKTAWTKILKYLQAGGNFFNFGGKAFAVPVKKTGGAWNPETEQVNYHKRLGILHYTVEASSGGARLETNIESLKKMPLDLIQEIYETYPRLTNSVDFSDESGSDGEREANLEALVLRRNALDELDCAPVVCFDRLKGEFAGGRWIFAGINIADAWTDKFDAQSFEALTQIASLGAVYSQLAPYTACFREVEALKIKIRKIIPSKANRKLESLSSFLEVVFPDGSGVVREPEAAWEKVKFGESEGVFDLPLMNKQIQKGFYKVIVRTSHRLADGFPVFENTHETGFWVSDESFLQKGNPLTGDRHFLYRSNEPFPVVGTTYMASDVHRRFLLEPNPEVWDKDFAAIKKAGVNMIRTGIWTGWKLMADEKGEVREEVLRAFEAFILTAKKYDIPVIFTFFAFMPEFFGGKNAYLDPQSIAGQKRFIAAFANRVRNSKDTIWDLINEPTFANPKMLWSCRPNGDEFEKRAWSEWLTRRYDAKSETELRDILSEKWRLTTEEDALSLPKDEDFDNVNIISERRLLKAKDFRLFAQYVFKSWAETMRETLQAAGNKSQMVTVGQDEGGLGDSPSTQFHADAVDFTCLHNWWANDDLLWDNVVSKAPTKPNLVEETGVMSYEKLDGSMWRGEYETAKLLERKMALALGANGCGFIEWVWNTNPYMKIDNEAGIGFLRVDKTAKPELRSFRRTAKFATENRKYFRGKSDENILLVIPHSYQFTPRNLATEATKKSVRVMHYYCRHTMRAVSEYNLDAILKEKNPPALIVVPSPQMLSETAAKNLLELVSGGATLAITGCFFEDENLVHQTQFDFLTMNKAVPVSSYDRFRIGDKYYETRFAGEKLQRVFKADILDDYIKNQDYGSGKILWCHLPLELNEDVEPIKIFYDYALREAKLTEYFKVENGSPSVLIRPTEFETAMLYTVIMESGDNIFVSFTHLPTKTNVQVNLDHGRAEMIFIDKQTGKILARSSDTRL